MGGRVNRKQKGNRGERQWAEFLRSQGVQARRGVQYSGGPDSPDVIHPDLPNLHAEVKRVERGLCLYQATEQAAQEAPEGARPYVAHRKNRKEWLVTMRAEDWLALVKPPAAPLVDLPGSPT
jgi:Holliday junction resolvase